MNIETITAGGKVLAHILQVPSVLNETWFPTPDDAPLQVGFVVRHAGEVVERHVHNPVERRLIGTSEVIVVQRGTCDVDVYDDDRLLVTTKELQAGDILITRGGGHGFRMRDDTLLLEVKQGPYVGPGEKDRF